MTVVRLDPAQAVEWLTRGDLVALPTETVYGLAARADDAAALARLFEAKGRPTNHPVIVHVAAQAELARWMRPEARPVAERLTSLFWPGPLSIVVPRADGVLDAVTGGQASVGLRCPAHPITRSIIEGLGVGVAMPSANRFGRVSPTRASHVEEDLGAVPFDIGLVDGGRSRVGVESTIVSLLDGEVRLLRPGAIAPHEIEAALGVPVVIGASSVRAPGVLASHYAPLAEVRTASAETLDQEVARALRERPRVHVIAQRATAAATIVYTRETLAATLYSCLRELDRIADVIVIELPDADGIGIALHDRIQKAAAPRPPRS